MEAEDKELILKLANFLSNLEEANNHYNFYLGGGCLRDLYFKGSFEGTKDFDIFAVPKQGSWSDIITKPIDLVKYCEHKTITTDYLSDMLERNVIKLVQGYADGILNPVDIIVYGKYLTVDEIAEDFDFNVNQCIMDSSEVWTYTEAFKEAKGTFKLIQTKSYCPERMAERYQRMLTRLGKGWS